MYPAVDDRTHTTDISGMAHTIVSEDDYTRGLKRQRFIIRLTKQTTYRLSSE